MRTGAPPVPSPKSLGGTIAGCFDALLPGAAPRQVVCITTSGETLFTLHKEISLFAGYGKKPSDPTQKKRQPMLPREITSLDGTGRTIAISHLDSAT